MTKLSYYLGNDGWVFLGNEFQDELDQSLGLIEPPKDFISEFVTTLLLIKEYCVRRNAVFLPVVAPAKTTIYLDKLQLVKIPGKSVFQQLINEARARDYNILDLRHNLRNARANYDTYSRMNSHWSDFGGWIAWSQITEELQALKRNLVLNDGLEVTSVEVVDAMNEFADLAGIKGANNWSMPHFNRPFNKTFWVADTGSLRECTGEMQVALEDIPMNIFNPKAQNDVDCLVICDSSISAISKFLNFNFRRIYYRNHHITHDDRVVNVPDLIRQTDAKIVFYVMAERYLRYHLGDLEGWTSINQFEVNEQSLEYEWPPNLQTRALQVHGGLGLETPLAIQLPKQPSLSEYLVQIRIASATCGQIMSSFSFEGKNVQKWHKVGRGTTCLYLSVPSSLVEDNLWIIKHPNLQSSVVIGVRARLMCA